ncbi:MAG: homoserine O-acetyltransferase MetX [Verrucomicrobiales bacterium]
MEVEPHFFECTEPISLQSGELLPGFTVAYESYGQLNDARDNALLVFHALSGSQHAAGVCTSVPGVGTRWSEDMYVGWWDDFIGPGKVLDTNKYFVICANYLGGCYGTTGPSSPHPETGDPWGSRFPHVSVADVVRSQMLLLDHLGIERLHAAIGASIGGLMALSVATLFPARVKLVVLIASGLCTTVLNRLILFEQILAIENDPHFHGGDFYNGQPPVYGLALARMISHKTFVHLDTIERRARGEVQQPGDQLSWYRLHDNVESYILHQGKKFVRRFDANTYLRICEMWSAFDPLRDAGVEDWRDLFKPCREQGHHYLIFTIDSDFCFYPEEQATLVDTLREARVSCMYITVHSDKGHDSFLLEPELYTPHLAYALEGARFNGRAPQSTPIERGDLF